MADLNAIAAELREIRTEVVAIGTEDDRRLDRIETALGDLRRRVDIVCRAIGGPARRELEKLQAEEAKRV